MCALSCANAFASMPHTFTLHLHSCQLSNLAFLVSNRIVFVAMSIPDYELMSYNMQELKRYINELKEVVVYYRKVTTKEAK